MGFAANDLLRDIVKRITLYCLVSGGGAVVVGLVAVVAVSTPIIVITTVYVVRRASRGVIWMGWVILLNYVQTSRGD